MSTSTLRPLRDVILLVDSSASLSGVFQGLMNEYILPCLEYFSGGSVSRSSSELQYGPVQFGLVAMNSPGLTYRQACTYYPVTCDAAKVVQWLKEMRFEGGVMEHSLRLSEGFAAVLELCDLMSTTREPCLATDQSVQQHCILICNFPPSSHPCVESMKYGGKTHEQLSLLMLERHLALSVIAPRSLPHFKKVFERSLVITEFDGDALAASDHSLHSGHLVLLQGFSLKGLKMRKDDEMLKKAKENEAKQATPLKYDVRMDTQSPALQTNTYAQIVDNSSQLLPSSFDSKTPPTQSSPRAGARSSSPSIANQVVHKAVEMTSTSASEENPASVPPPSVFPAPSPRAPSSVASPQRQSVPTTVASVSPPNTTAGPPPGGLPNPVSLGSSHTRPGVPFSGSISIAGNVSIASSIAHLPTSLSAATSQVVQPSQSLTNPTPARSFTQSGHQPGNQSFSTSQPSSQPSMSLLVQNPTNATQSQNRSQNVASTAASSSGMMPIQQSQNQNVQTPSSVTQGFPNVVATGTTLPSSSNPPSYPLGATLTTAVSASNQGRQHGGDYQAAVAAAEFAVQQANAQLLPAHRMPAQMLQTGQIPTNIPTGQMIAPQSSAVAHNVSASQGKPSQGMPAQPNLNIGMSSLSGASQSSTSGSQTLNPTLSSGQQSMPGIQLPQGSTTNLTTGQAHQKILGTQTNTAVTLPPGQQRPLTGGQLHATSQPGVSTAQPVLGPQFGMLGSQQVRAQQPGTAQPQPPTGLQQNLLIGQQSPNPQSGLRGAQSSHSNQGMSSTQPSHLAQHGMQSNQPSQGMQPGVAGVQGTQSTMPNTPQMGAQQGLHSGHQGNPGQQPIMGTGQQSMPVGQQMHQGQPGTFGAQLQPPQQQQELHIQDSRIIIIAIMNQQLQPTIWNGTVDVMDQPRGQKPVKRPMQCTISAKREHVPELHPDTWPQRITLVAYPKQATSLIMSLMKLNQQQNMVRVVTFNFVESPDHVFSLRLLMSNDQSQKHFGIVHFNNSVPQCTIKALILVWNEKTLQFTGLIPMEQEKFVEVLKRVFRRTVPGQQQPQMGMGGQQQPMMAGQQVAMQQSGVSTMSGQQPIMSVAQANQPGTSTDPSMLHRVPMNIGGMQTQPQHTQPLQPLQPRPDKAMQFEKLLLALDRSSPEQQQQLFQKMPQITPEVQQSLLQKVQAMRVQKQQQIQRQQQLHAMSQQQQGMMPGQLSDVMGGMGQPGMSSGIGQQAQQQQSQQQQMQQQSQLAQQQGLQPGGMGMQMGMQRAPMQQQQQQQQPGMDPSTFQWQP